MKLTFLGTNGWYATKTGHTVCAVIETANKYIVLDAGDGLYKLDDVATDSKKSIDIFLSHFHLDHLIGLHVLIKFRFEKRVRIFGGPGTRKILRRLIDHPFTAPFSEMRTNVSIYEIKMGSNIISDIQGKAQYSVTCRKLNHVDRCLGFRFEIDGKVAAYCTDTGPCENVASLGNKADILIVECALLPGEAISKFWGHLNPEAAARLAKKAACKRLILTHFEALKYSTMKKRACARRAAARIFANTIAARDGLIVKF